MTVRIVEGQLPYTAGDGIEITANKVIKLLLRQENNLIILNDENEIYTDLQLADGILPTDEFPVGVTVGRVNSADGWYMSGTMLNFKTTSGDYGRWIYGTDNHIYYDTGTGTWQQVYTGPEVDALFAQLRSELSTVAFSGDYNDLLNRPVIPVMGDGILTITQNGVSAGTFSANQATDDTIQLTDTTYPAMSAGELGTGTDTTQRTVSAKVIADYVTGKVPPVVDNLTSTSTTSALSANQGKVLNDKIADLMALGKFLSLRDATTGLPISFPLQIPYAYSTGDYFMVQTVSSATPPVNYRPVGSSYDGTASSTAETDELEVGDVYIYDGSVWLLQSNHGKTVTFANIAGDPYDNANLTTALNAKQDTLTAGTGIDITSNVIKTTFNYGESSSAAADATKTVSIPAITTLNAGQTIIVKTTNTNTAGNTSLQLNNFTAYQIRYNGAALTSTTDSYVWGANMYTLFMFDGSHWEVIAKSYDLNTTYTINFSNDAGKYTAGTGTYAITRYSVVMQKDNGTWEKITDPTANYSTGTTKTVNTSGFILNQIRYYNTTTTVASGGLVATNTFSQKAATVDMRYSTNCGAATGWTEGDYLYLVGTIGADGLFYLDTTTWRTTTLPTTNDGKLYIRMGLVLATDSYNISFFSDRPIFYYENGLKIYQPKETKILTQADYASLPNSKNTDGNFYFIYSS